MTVVDLRITLPLIVKLSRIVSIGFPGFFVLFGGSLIISHLIQNGWEKPNGTTLGLGIFVPFFALYMLGWAIYQNNAKVQPDSLVPEIEQFLGIELSCGSRRDLGL